MYTIPKRTHAPTMKRDFIDNRSGGGNTAPMTNKELVERALAGLLETGDVDTLGQFLGDDFVHRRPGLDAATKGEWLAAVRAALVPLAGMRVDIHHVLADGDHVVVHSRRRLPGPGPEITVVDIWRLADGRIVEGWEVIEPTAQSLKNLTWWAPHRP